MSPRLVKIVGELAMTIQINDEPRTVPTDATVHSVLRELGLSERKGLAIAINDHVVPRATWPQRLLAESDRLLVIQATQGG